MPLSPTLRISLRTKIGILVSFVIVLISILMGVLYILDQRDHIRRFEKTFIEDTQNSVQTLSYSIMPHLLDNDFVSINNMVSYNKNRSYRAYVLIEDNKNLIVAHDDIKRLGSSFEIPSADSTETAGEGLILRYKKDGKEFIDISYPVKAGDLVLGKVRIGLTMDWLQKERNRVRQIILEFILITIAIVMFGILLVFMLANRITKPILLMKQSAERIGRGEYGQKVHVEGEDEVAMLAASFNQMAADLKNSREQLVEKNYVDSIIANMNDALIVVDTDCLIKTVNRTLLNLLGYEENELLYKPLGVIFAEETLLFKGPMHDELINKGYIGNTEKNFLSKDGRKIPVLFSSAVMRSDSKIEGAVCVASNISELKKTQETLKESEKHYRLLFEQSPLGVFHYDTNLLITDCNNRFADILQSPRERLVGLDMKTLKDQNVLPAIRVALAGDDGAYEGFYRATTSPAEIWISMRTAPLFDNKGNIKGGSGIVEDITYRKLTEEALEERINLAMFTADTGASLTQKGNLQDILQQCTEAIVRHLNAAFARIWTLNKEDNMLELQASAGMYTHTDGGHSRVPVGKFKIGLIAEECKPHLTNSVIGDPRVGDQEWARREGMVAFAGYPLTIENRIVGVMAMFSRQPLSETVLEALAAVADAIAIGIEHKRSEEKIIRKVEELEKFYEMAVGRELKMKELKEEIAGLKAELSKCRGNDNA